MSVLAAGSTIGIIGGGQLGRMLAACAARLSYKTIILEPGANCPAAQLANSHIQAAYDDADALTQLADLCDVITYEFENVPVDALSHLGKTPVYPPANALAISQDRLDEKQFLNDNGIATAPFDAVDADNIVSVYESMQNRAVLKTRRFGYDGKGQAVLVGASAENARAALEELKPSDCILEGFIDFTREISIIAARSPSGDIACYEPAENVHSEGVLRTSTVPANISKELRKSAESIAETILTNLEYVGVIGVEFFVASDDKLLVNEFAPRVHNSGHWTEAACVISQFEQHIRAICGLALGDTVRHSDCVMENLIGDDMDHVPQILSEANNLLHLYGKEETRAGRKMGHVTRLLGPAS
ncbi:MAG: 5-(carboxyamino)imidazole ribonucleotide synthase [Rhizobiaceae bacterium]